MVKFLLAIFELDVGVELVLSFDHVVLDDVEEFVGVGGSPR